MAFDELNYALCSDFAVPGLTQGDVRRLFAAIDVDGSGEVSCDEFIDAIESVRTFLLVYYKFCLSVTVMYMLLVQPTRLSLPLRSHQKETCMRLSQVPLPELKHKVGYRSLPSPAFLKTRFAFQVRLFYCLYLLMIRRMRIIIRQLNWGSFVLGLAHYRGFRVLRVAKTICSAG